MSDIKTMVNGLNKFLTAIYGEETRLSILLAMLGFEPQQIDFLRKHHLEQVVTSFITAINECPGIKSKDNRLRMIITRRFGLDGKPPETLQAIGASMGITRERVRQLEQKAIRRCKYHKTRNFLQTSLYQIASSLLSNSEPVSDS